MNKGKKTIIGTGVIFGTMAAISSVIAVSKKLKKNKEQSFLESIEYTTGKVRNFGTLYLDNEKQKRPKDFIEFKDIPEYKGQKIKINDTDKNEEYMLTWVEVNDDNKKLLICDRNILKGMSWNELNDQNLIFGKVVIIEGKKYILRLLTGYSEKKNYKANEWDKYIVNTDKIDSLPICKECDMSNSTKQQDEKQKLNGDSNKLWNWYNFSSFTQSEGLRREKFCIIRGFYSITYSNQSIKDLKYETVGYRPVLELIE